jgi:hypothetical protein
MTWRQAFDLWVFSMLVMMSVGSCLNYELRQMTNARISALESRP